MATLVAASIRRILGPPGTETHRRLPDSTPAWMNRRSAGSMASASEQHGKPMSGAAFARKKPPRRQRAARSKPTTNLPGNPSPLPWRAPISRLSRPRNRKRTRRRHSISTRNIPSSPTKKKSRDLRATSTWRRSSRALPQPKTRSTPHRRRGRRPFARSRW